MRKPIVLLGVLMMVGCVSPASMRNQPAYFASTSTKAPADIVSCALAAWSSNSAKFPVTTARAGPLTTITLNSGSLAGADMIADIYDSGRVEMRRRPAIWSGLDETLAASLKNCL
jgi:hypothetical protein